MYAQDNILCQFGLFRHKFTTVSPPILNHFREELYQGFGEHCGDAITHKILDHDTQKIIYRSAVRPKKFSTPNHRLAPHGGEVSAPSDPSEDKISSGSPLGSPEGSSPKPEGPYSLHQVQR